MKICKQIYIVTRNAHKLIVIIVGKTYPMNLYLIVANVVSLIVLITAPNALLQQIIGKHFLKAIIMENVYAIKRITMIVKTIFAKNAIIHG